LPVLRSEPMKSKAIKPHSAKLTKTETAHLAIKRAILHCEIPEGTFLSESAIMKRDGIGRTPFRSL